MSCQTFVSTCKALRVQTHATLLANNSQHYWMLHVLSVCTFCCMLLGVVVQSLKLVKLFEPTTPNISFVLWSLKRSTTMLDPFAQLLQHCWCHACTLHMISKVLWVVSFPQCAAGSNIVGSFHTTTHIVSPIVLGVVVSVCT